MAEDQRWLVYTKERKETHPIIILAYSIHIIFTHLEKKPHPTFLNGQSFTSQLWRDKWYVAASWNVKRAARHMKISLFSEHINSCMHAFVIQTFIHSFTGPSAFRGGRFALCLAARREWMLRGRTRCWSCSERWAGRAAGLWASTDCGSDQLRRQGQGANNDNDTRVIVYARRATHVLHLGR